MTSVTAARARLRRAGQSGWNERSARMYEELRSPARAMIRRAFRGAFSDHEIEDVYSSAWVGTLRTLAARHVELTDEEVRKYVLTAVAHQASKELRRRGRKPTAPLEKAGAVADLTAQPDERATQTEDSQVTRDLLASLPRRRRAVLMLRYGWGLEPRQICELVKGLSPRAYRKEITRGIDDLTERMRRLERGEWCADREPILKSFAAGLADVEERRQAEHHLAHCRHCADFVGKLTGHLHDLGGAVAIPGSIDALERGHAGLVARVADLVDRARGLVGSAGRGDAAVEPGAQLATSGGVRGGGAAGAGILAKVASLGGSGKLALACVTGGVAATCVATGVGPLELPHREGAPGPVETPAHAGPPVVHGGAATAGTRYEDAEPQVPAPQPPADEPSAPVEAPPAPPAPTSEPEPTTTTTTATPTAPPPEQEFGLASQASAAPTTSATAPADGGGSGSTASAVQQEFGP